jgi:hypothetical protein
MKPTKKQRECWFQRLMGVVGNIQIAVKAVDYGRKATPEELCAMVGMLTRQRETLDAVIRDMKGEPLNEEDRERLARPSTR